MKIRSKFIKTIYFFAVVALLIIIPLLTIIVLTKSFYRHQEAKKVTPGFDLSPQKPLLHIINSVLRQIDHNKGYDIEIRTQATDIMRDTSQILCTGIHARVHTIKNQQTIEIITDQGIIHQDEYVIIFPHAVQAQSHDTFFRGTQITYDIRQHRITSQEPFSIKNSTFEVKAHQGIVDLKSWQVDLQEDVETTFIQLDSQQLQK